MTELEALKAMLKRAKIPFEASGIWDNRAQTTVVIEDQSVIIFRFNTMGQLVELGAFE